MKGPGDKSVMWGSKINMVLTDGATVTAELMSPYDRAHEYGGYGKWRLKGGYG